MKYKIVSIFLLMIMLQERICFITLLFTHFQVKKYPLLMLGLLSEAMQDNAATSWLQHHIHPTQQFMF